MDDQFEKYFAFALRFLSYRARSIKEVRDRLKKKKFPEEISEKVIQTLIEQKFLDDRAFAFAWFESRMRSRPKAVSVVKQELLQKGVDREIIEEIIDENRLSSAEQEQAGAQKLAEKAIKKYGGLPPQERKQKMAAYLGRRGYGWDIIKEVIENNRVEE